MINYKFIQELEGNKTVGYVPNPENSKSGVTIASGFDIGQRNREELKAMFDIKLVNKFSKYCGKKGVFAASFLEENPLEITEEECVEINKISHSNSERNIRCEWGLKSRYCHFCDLSVEQQTVIASLSFQYGSLLKSTPIFWEQVTNGCWVLAIANLRNFGDNYPTRRNKEADYLEGKLAKKKP